MRLPKLMASIGTAVLLLSACGGEPEAPETNNAPQATPPPAPSPAPTKEEPKPGEAQPFESPIVPGAPKDPTSIANLGLLKPSDPDEEVKKVPLGKENPFEIFTVEPAPSDPSKTGAKIPALDPRQVPSPPQLPEAIGPSIEENIDVAVRLLPTLEARQIPSVPELPAVSPNVGANGQPLPIPTRVNPQPQIPPPPPQEAQQVPDVPGLPADFGPALPTPLGTPGNVAGAPSGQGYRPGRRPGQTPSQGFGPGPIARDGQTPGQGFSPGPIARDGQSPGQGVSPDPIARDGQAPGQSFGPGEVPPGDGIPLPLSTDLAQNVEVSGIIQVGRDIQVIVKAPNEQTTRYVKVGQKIANGEVLVKRVEQLKESEPVVILEQNGIEVRKVVGEKNIEVSE